MATEFNADNVVGYITLMSPEVREAVGTLFYGGPVPKQFDTLVEWFEGDDDEDLVAMAVLTYVDCIKCFDKALESATLLSFGPEAGKKVIERWNFKISPLITFGPVPHADTVLQ